jgi:O-antigen/teichoic acid export membrane protein
VPLILGWLAGPVVLASFVLADKVRSAAQSLLMPMSQALYPRMSHLFSHDHAGAIALLKRSGMISLCIATITSLTLWFGADLVIHLLGGPGFAEAVNVLRWLAPAPIFIAVSNLFGVQVLLACGKTRIINITTSLIGLTVLALVYPVIEKYAVQGAAALILLAEITVACVFVIVVLNNKNKWSKND